MLDMADLGLNDLEVCVEVKVVGIVAALELLIFLGLLLENLA